MINKKNIEKKLTETRVREIAREEIIKREKEIFVPMKIRREI
jgi:hypothetical protein